MEDTHRMLKLFLGVLIPLSVIISLYLFYLYRKRNTAGDSTGIAASDDTESGNSNSDQEGLMCFQGGEDLTVADILDAPGEVIGKSSYGTLYKACLSKNDSNLLLRFLRPACSGNIREVIPVVHSIGLVRHPNLVPLQAFYMGPRGEKLLVYPYFVHGNLAQFIKDGNSESHKWDVIYNIALGLVKGLAYLHSGLHKPMIHGNLKSKNILLTPDFQPYISDYGLHLLLNPTAGQEMLETSANQGYKAPELIKIKDSCESTDIYSLGIVLLELLTGREPVNDNSSDSQEIYLPNVIRKAILDHRIKDMYHPDIVLNLTDKQRHRTEDRALKLVQLAMSCCSTSPSLRPLANEVVRKVEDLSKEPALQSRRT
ncbi:putative kinase-like protein TMKL1 [Silene latifolia]|uniref:putative kinase-like protein TMKL1 n=1 Tax=Silene latifolia TaxID=37657 RepID=UPI003D7760CD